jgi:hypothetical protein
LVFGSLKPEFIIIKNLKLRHAQAKHSKIEPPKGGQYQGPSAKQI